MQPHSKKIVFLDRDGTLIYDKDYLNDPQQIHWIPEVFEGLRLLRDNGFEFVIVTNQSGLARRRVDLKQMDAIHLKMRNELAAKAIPLLAIYYCPHLPNANSPDRKPNPGMIERGLKDFHGVRSESWMIGDKWSDVEAGLRASLKTALLKAEPRTQSETHPLAQLQSPSFLEICQQITIRSQSKTS